MDKPNDRESVASLQTAMNVADVIRRKMTQHGENVGDSSKESGDGGGFTPGLMEGAMVCGAALIALTPLRRLLPLKQNPLLEMVFTTCHFMISAQCGLYAGSLYGAHVQLQKLASLPPSSSMATAVCQDPLVVQALHQQEDRDAMMPHTDDQQRWNPNLLVMQDFQKALQVCRQRNQQTVASDPASNEISKPQELQDSFW